MAFSSYSSSFPNRRFGSYYGRYSRQRRSSFKRRSTGNQIAARQQKDQATVTINRIASEKVVFENQGSSDSPKWPTSSGTAINHWQSLAQSTYYGNYSSMYDQVRLDKIRVKVTGNQLGSAVQAQAYTSPAVVLAFDRNGLNEGQPLEAESVSTYSSAQIKNWSQGNSFVMYQTIYPSTMAEKSQFLPISSLVPLSSENTSANVPSNPCSLVSTTSIPFKPVTLISVNLSDVTYNGVQTFAFMVEYEYVVTFRGMRKPSLK